MKKVFKLTFKLLVFIPSTSCKEKKKSQAFCEKNEVAIHLHLFQNQTAPVSFYHKTIIKNKANFNFPCAETMACI